MGIFKAYDIRGIVPENLNEELMYKIGRATVKLLKVSKMIVGRDARLSSESFFKAYSLGLSDEGVTVINAGVLATPTLYFAVGKYHAPAGAIITASHNPKEYNGLKIVKENVIPLNSEELLELKSIVESNPDWNYNDSKNNLSNLNFESSPDILSDYKEEIYSIINPTLLKKFNILVDSANGVGSLPFNAVMSNAGHNITLINEKPDGNFPAHEPNPLILENRQEIMDKINHGDFDIGVAFDGDADRCFFFDEKGNFLPGDFVTAILAEELLKLNPNSNILYDLRASWAVPDFVSRAGGKPEMIRVGHIFFKARMREIDAIFAGEVTGHYYFKSNYYAEDAILPLLLLLKKMSDSNKKLSDILSGFDSYHISGERNYVIFDADKKIKEIEDKYGKQGKCSFVDGISIEFSDWHFNVRKSNTESLLRLNLEAKSKKLLDEKLAEVEEFIKN